MNPLVCTTESAQETRRLAAALARFSRSGDIVLLSGDLGAGKTTFAQGFGQALGIDEPITSPTFTLVRHYEIPPGPTGLRTLLHADIYRLDHLGEVADLGLGQLVEDDGVALVEWGEAAEPVLGADALSLLLRTDVEDEEARNLVVSATGASWSPRWSTVVTALAPWTVPA